MDRKYKTYVDNVSSFLADKGVKVAPSTEDLQDRIKILVKRIEEQEEELEYSRERIYKAFYYSHIAQMVTGTFGDIKSVNQAFADLLGYDPKDLIKVNTYNLVPKELKEKELEFHAEVKHTLDTTPKEEVHVWEKKYLHKNGNIVKAYVSIFPVLRDWHNVCYYVGRLPKIVHSDEI